MAKRRTGQAQLTQICTTVFAHAEMHLHLHPAPERHVARRVVRKDLSEFMTRQHSLLPQLDFDDGTQARARPMQQYAKVSLTKS